MPKTGEGLVLVLHKDGSREVQKQSGEGVRHSRAAEGESNKFCRSCYKPIGVNAKYHLINGAPHHADCCRAF